jgi:hypothetical protein
VSRPADITTGCFNSFIKLFPDILKKNSEINQAVRRSGYFYQIKVYANVSYPWFLHIICRKIPIFWDLTSFLGIKQNLFLETSNKQGWLWTVSQEVSCHCTVYFLNSSRSNFWSLSRTRLNRVSKGMEYRRYKTENKHWFEHSISHPALAWPLASWTWRTRPVTWISPCSGSLASRTCQTSDRPAVELMRTINK